MLKSLLVPLTGEKSDIVALETALAAARPFDGHIEALLVRPDASQFAMRAAATEMGSSIMTPQLIAAFEEQDKRQAAAARRAFEKFCGAHDIAMTDSPPGPARVSAVWREKTGGTVHEITGAARFFDVSVFGRSHFCSSLSAEGIGNVLLGSGRPILIAADRAKPDLAGTIAIAWKETAEAARAVSQAMPLLRLAQKITVFAASEGRDAGITRASAEGLANALRWHKFDVKAVSLNVSGDADKAVVSAAMEVGATLLVMGGYGHSRLREFVFGGFTRHVLTGAPLPIFLAH